MKYLQLKKIITKLFFSTSLVLVFLTVKAQNASYNLNSIPVNGSGNAVFGWQSLFSNTTGSSNSATGFRTLYFNTTGSNNTATGYRALTFNTTGGQNTANGVYALYSNTTGQQNTAVGYRALFPNTTGEDNVAVGFQALNSNTTGSLNTALGYFADVTINNLTNATAIGSRARVSTSNTIQLGDTKVTKVFAGTGTTATLVAGGLQITGGVLAAGKVLTSDANGVATWQMPAGGAGWSLTGNAGTVDGVNFIGTTDNKPFNIRVNNQKAGKIDTDINGNAFYGYQSGNVNTGKWNTANGAFSLFSNTVGNHNTAIGHATLLDNTSGIQNTAVGSRALTSNIVGSNNIAVGYGALYSNNSDNNTAMGYNALFWNTTGGNNVAIGSIALNENTTGDFNTAVGSVALDANTTGYENTAFGSRTLLSNTSGNYNTAIGDYAMIGNATGSNNTALGYDATTSSSALTNATVIGSEAIVNASNKIRLGDATVTKIEGTVMFTVSDERFKDGISETDVKGLEFIKKLRPVVYNFNTKKFEGFLTKNLPEDVQRRHMNKDFAPSTAIRQSGFIAQEVEKAAKEVGYDFNGVHVPENDNDNYSLAYAEFVVPLVKAVQEQQQQIEELKKALASFTDQSVSRSSVKLSNETVVLNQNAPNPFKDQTIINFEIPQTAGKAEMSFFDNAGKLVKNILINTKGKSQLTVFGNDLSSGAYTYSLIVDGKVMSKKMIKN